VLRKSPASVRESRLTSTRLPSPTAPHGRFVFSLTVSHYESRIFKCQIYLLIFNSRHYVLLNIHNLTV